MMFTDKHTHNTEREREILLECVDKEWKVRKEASRLCNVGPTGILYIGYLEPGSIY
jgi:hypothetical protein